MEGSRRRRNHPVCWCEYGKKAKTVEISVAERRCESTVGEGTVGICARSQHTAMLGLGVPPGTEGSHQKILEEEGCRWRIEHGRAGSRRLGRVGTVTLVAGAGWDSGGCLPKSEIQRKGK